MEDESLVILKPLLESTYYYVLFCRCEAQVKKLCFEVMNLLPLLLELVNQE